MWRTTHRSSSALWVALGLITTLLALAPVQGLAAPPVASADNYTITYNGRTYNGTTTTFSYTVEAISPPGVSHWNIALGSCVAEENHEELIVATNYSPWEYGRDPTTGVVGIKFDEVNILEGTSKSFSLTLLGEWEEGEVRAAIKAGTYSFYYTITGPVCGPEPSGDPSIDLEKTVSQGPYSLGETITYTYEIENTGDVALSSLTLEDDQLGTITLTVDSLEPGETTSAEVEHIVTQDDIDAGSLTNVAIVAGSPPSGDDVRDEDTVTVRFDRVADLQVTKRVNNDEPAEGETIVFTVLVFNAGPHAADDIVVRDALPAGLTYLSDDSGGDYSSVTNRWSVGFLAVGSSKTLQLTATVDAGTSGLTIRNVAEVAASSLPDPVPENNRDSAIVIVGRGGGGGGSLDERAARVIISEIAWAGNASDPDAEWIELRNIGLKPVNLAGWRLRWRVKDPVTQEDLEWRTVFLYGVLQPGLLSAWEIEDPDLEWMAQYDRRGDEVSWFVTARPARVDESFLVLERRSEATVSDRAADVLYDELLGTDWYELSDRGEVIELLNAAGEVVDTANAFPSEDGRWPAGNALTFGTMERTDPLGPDEPGNWHTNIGLFTYGRDGEARPLVASAGVVNSLRRSEAEIFALLGDVVLPVTGGLETFEELVEAVHWEPNSPWARLSEPMSVGFFDAAGGGGTASTFAPYIGQTSENVYCFHFEASDGIEGIYMAWVELDPHHKVLIPFSLAE